MKGKRCEPDKKDKIKDLGQISGIWHKYILFNGTEVFNSDQEFPVILEYENLPLPSDANWREDIEYRRRLLIPRAQVEK